MRLAKTEPSTLDQLHLNNSFQSIELATEAVTRTLFKQFPIQSSSYASQKTKCYADAIIKFKKYYEDLTSQFKAKVKEITLPVDQRDWDEGWQQYLQSKYTNIDTNQFAPYRRAFFDFLRSLHMKEVAQILDNLQDYKFCKVQELIQATTIKIIQKVLCQLQTDLRIQLHVQLRVSLTQILKIIFTENLNYLSSVIDSYNFEEEGQKRSIKMLYQSLKKQFRELGNAILKLASSKFYNFSSNNEVQELNIIIKQLFSDKNIKKESENLEKLKKAMVQYYKSYQKAVVQDVFNNLAKTFSIEMTPSDQKKYRFALKEIKNFNFTFSFRLNLGLFPKIYKSWWRGKLQVENTAMYQKHWYFINYLKITAPQGVVQYSDVREEEKGKEMKFIMEKATFNCQNFQIGYKYFHTLTIRQKVKFIIDLSESLIELEEHGINHFDITMRNAIKVGDRFKLIDFDVARMVDVDFDYSKYSYEEIVQIRIIRQQLIKWTKFLMRRELRQEKFITRTHPQKPTTPIQNINRLAEYYSLINQIQILKLFKQQNSRIREKFYKQQRLEIIFEYEKYIVGKRDCNKFALMLLKLLYSSNQKLFQQSLTLRVEQFLKDFKKERGNIDFSKYAQFFKLDPDVSKSLNIQLLKLISQLLTPEVEKRIPMRLFYLRLLKILKISQYRLIINPQKPKQSLSKKFDQNFISIQVCLDKAIDNRKRTFEIQLIENIFKKNVNYAKDHHLECIEIYKQLTTSLGNTLNFPMGNFQKKNEINIDNFVKLNEKWSKRTDQSLLVAFNQIKRIRKAMYCYEHGEPIDAECKEPGCSKKWLCSICLSNIYYNFERTEPNIHCRKVKISQLKHMIEHHKISHYHDPINRNKEINCLLMQRQNYIFRCKECLQATNSFQDYDQFYLINKQANEVYNKIYLNESESKLLSKIPYNVAQKSVIKIDYDHIFNNVKKLRHMTNDQFQNLQDKLEDAKQFITKWIQTIGIIHKEITQQIYTSSQFKTIENALQYLQIEPNLLFQLRKRSPFELNQYITKLKLPLLAKIQQLQLDTYILDTCEYLIDKIKQAFNSLCTQLQKILYQCRKQRIQYTITHKKIFYYFDRTAQTRQSIKSDLKIIKIMPSSRTLQRRQRRLQRQKQRQYERSLIKNDDQNTKRPDYESNIDQQSAIQIITHENNTIKVNKSFAICPCYQDAKQTTNHQQLLKQDFRITAICTAKDCKHRFVCRQCKNKHNNAHKSEFYHFKDIKQEKQRLNEINFFKTYMKESKTYLRIDKILQKVISDVQVQMVNPINFSQQLLTNIQDLSKFKKKIFQPLKKAAFDQNHQKFIDAIWIATHLTDNPVRFLEALSYGTQRYVTQIDLTTTAMRDCYNVLKTIDSETFLTSPQIYKQLTNYWFKDKYQRIVNTAQSDTPMPFNQIFNRHCHKVEELIITPIKQTNEDEIDACTQIKKLERTQFLDKMVRNHYNDFDINLYWNSFKPYRNNLLHNIQRFSNLKKLEVTDAPNWDQPAVFKSIQIQTLLEEIFQLKQIKLQCLNGFDLQCHQLLKQKHKDCKVQIQSFSDQVVQNNWMNQLFSGFRKFNLPFEYEGQMLSPFQNQNISRGQFQLDFTKRKINETFTKLSQIESKRGNKVIIMANQLSDNHISDGQPSYFQVRMNYWCRKTYGTQLTFTLQELINGRYGQIMKIFAPLEQKFTQLRYLTLHGLLISGGYDPNADLVHLAVKDYLKSLNKLETLHIVKCFGVSLSLLFQNRATLKKLIIEQSVFKLEDVDQTQNFAQLQSLLLRRVGLFQISNKKLESKEITSILDQFKLETLEVLVLNEFYELQYKQLEWIKKCPLKKLSLKRCFRLTTEIITILEQIKTLQEIDITATSMDDYKLRQRLKIVFNSFFAKPPRIYNHLLDIQDADISSLIVLKQISRMASAYHIKELQHIFDKNAQKKLPLNLYDIRSITLDGSRVRQISQHYLLMILSKLPDIQEIKIINCQWKNAKTPKNILKYSQIPYMIGLQKLKELTLINADITKLQFTMQFKFLRRLVLQRNHYLEKVEGLSFNELIYLDVSQTGVRILRLDPQQLPRLQMLNLQNTPLPDLPGNLKKFKSLRVIWTKLQNLDNLQDQSRQEKAKKSTNNPKKVFYLKDLNEFCSKLQADSIYEIMQRVGQLNLFVTSSRKTKNEQTAGNSQNQQNVDNACFILTLDLYKKLQQTNQLGYHLLDYEIFKVEQDVKGYDNYLWFQLYCQSIRKWPPLMLFNIIRQHFQKILYEMPKLTPRSTNMRALKNDLFT